MPEERHPVKLATPTGLPVEGVILYDKSSERCRLTLQWTGGVITVEAPDYFEALGLIRAQLEPEALRPICYGASRSAWPSGMCRNMAKGLKAYRTKIGERASIKDLVHIFDTGPDVEAVSFEEQRAYHEQWLMSVGHGRFPQ
jgi:hypothetical protein